ncbi:GNAT family N-acetyltransferase [Actinoplanes sp. NPDC023714]|uniref:GNAT family N-acetyltransferase n=1 Tax=Actinoplanes sp. NPDC023714 TaxID=3154322 RepID=UPI0033FA49EA
MRLAEITTANYEAALALAVRPDQQDLVEPVTHSLAEAYVYRDRAWPRLIYDGDELVGFVMAFLDFAWGATDPRPEDLRSGLWRLAVAADAQGRGYGTFAVDQVCAMLRARGCASAYVTYEPRAGGPEPFYRKLGFAPTGELSEGQVVAVRPL